MMWTRRETAAPISTARAVMAVFADTIAREGLSGQARPWALV